MRRSLLLALLATDLAFLAYWVASGLMELQVLHPSSSMMYPGYGDARVCAWNWSFLPLDLAFSMTGLLAVRWARRGDPRWQPMALVSLTLTCVAGVLAVSYWVLTNELEASWVIPNVLLALWPLPYMRELVMGAKHPRPPARFVT